MNHVWSDILAQGENTEHVITHLMGTEADRLDNAVGFINPEKPILLIGIASAAYLCWPAQVYLSKSGLVTRVMNAADALYEEWPGLEKANVVINSRSGETAEIVKLAGKLNEANIPFLGITNEPESTLAKMATCTLWANTRKDDLVSINIVTGMMLTTLLWAAKLTGKMDVIRVSLGNLPEMIQSVLDQAVIQSNQLASYFAGVRPIYLLARGASLGAALCGRLVLEEISRHPAVVLEAAEFRQGPNEVVDQKFGAILFIPSGETAALVRNLGKEISMYGGVLVSIGGAEYLVGMPGLTFQLPRCHPIFSPILEIIPIQVLAYKLAELQGITPGSVRYISKIIREEGV